MKDPLEPHINQDGTAFNGNHAVIAVSALIAVLAGIGAIVSLF